MSESHPEAVTLTRPGFRQPASLQPDPLDPAATSLSPPAEADDAGEESGPPKGPGTASIPSSGGSSLGEPRSRDVVSGELALAVAGVLVVVAGVARLFVRWRLPGRRLRAPAPSDYDAVGRPLGRIFGRHLPIDVAPGVARSLWDGAQATGAFMGYVERGPVIEHIKAEEES